MVTHDDHLATYADRVFHIRDGRIIKIEDNQDGKKGKKREEDMQKRIQKETGNKLLEKNHCCLSGSDHDDNYAASADGTGCNRHREWNFY